MLGLVCHWIEEKRKPRSGEIIYENTVGTQTLQLGRYLAGAYTEDKIRGVYLNNILGVKSALQKILGAGIRHYRLSSDMLPLIDKVGGPSWAFQDEKLRSAYSDVGKMILQNSMRVTAHPGQFCVINSDHQHVIQNAISDLQYHAALFDALGLPDNPRWAINIHAGKSGNWDSLVSQINDLPSNVKSRLTLENCENVASVKDLLLIHEKTSVPIVFDSHHHIFNDGGMKMEEAFEKSYDTWVASGQKPLQHISNTQPGLESGSKTERRKHSDFIHYVPEVQLEFLKSNLIDVEVEAKMKNRALLQMSEQFSIPL